MLQGRSLTIISLLLENAQGLSGDELAKLIGVSARTIRRDMQLLQSNQIPGAIVHASIQNGYRLEVLDQHEFSTVENLLKQPIAKEDVDFFILEQLILTTLNNTCISQMELAEKLYISLSTLKNNIKNVERYLVKYQLKLINYQNKGIKIHGKETQIRYMISEYIFLKYKSASHAYDLLLLSDIDIPLLRKCIIQITGQQDLDLADLSIENLVTHLAILIKRNQDMQFIHDEKETVRDMQNTKEFQTAVELSTMLAQHFHISLNVSEICYIAQHLIASKKYAGSDKFKPDHWMRRLIERIIHKIHETCGIDFALDDTLIHWLSLHLDISINRLIHHMNIRNESLDLIKKEYPMAFQIAVIAAKVIEETKQVKVTENEIGYIAIHFSAALNRRIDLTHVTVKKALLVCGTGIGMAVLIKSKVKEYFKERLEIVDTIPSYKLTEEKIETVDIVLSTIPISHLHSNKIIHINSVCAQDDIAMIEQKAFHGNGIDKKAILTFFQEDFFYTGMDFHHKWDVLNFMTDQMVEKGMMHKIGKLSVNEREELFSTELSNLLAIPHALYNDVNQTIIPTLILREPIVWNKKYVQVILLINVAKGDFAIWDAFFPQLIKYLVKEKGIQSILKEPTYQNFTKKIMERFHFY